MRWRQGIHSSLFLRRCGLTAVLLVGLAVASQAQAPNLPALKSNEAAQRTVAGTDAGCLPTVVVVASADVEAPATDKRVRELLCYVAEELEVGGRALPNMMVIHVSAKGAAVADLSTGTRVRAEHFPGRVEPIYYLWLIGMADDDKVAVLLASAIADRYRLKPSREAFSQAVRHACIRANATVNVHVLIDPGRR